ncbi:hypothetical protein ACTHOQ_06375 [Solibacillus silvestris]|uniref:hypothetical protein n=1 Tax=Solibacillus silvestris TaxID=76853 RepID=UPI003F7EA43F
MFQQFDFLQQGDVTQYEQMDIPQTIDYNGYSSMDQPPAFSNNAAIFQHPDPLTQAQQYEMPKPKLHFVQPHYVDSYIKQDGTFVEGYYRNGGFEDGSYLRSNPDGIKANNLGK